MRFYVIFTCDQSGVPVSIPGFHAGLWAFRYLQEAGYDPELFDGWVQTPHTHEVWVEVNKDTADKTGLFNDFGRAKVYVPHLGLNKYSKLQVQQEKDLVTMRIILDDEKILKDWEAAGFPTRWDVSSDGWSLESLWRGK